jgi:phenylalanyl-tRNA synthetase beta chain
MNISIPHSWLKDYIKTDAKTEDIARILSLHSFSVEKIVKTGDDEIFEIEVTPNRGDALSVLGVARELKVLLPRQGFKCEWLKKEYEKPENIESKDEIEVVIKDNTLVPRFSAVIMDNVKFSKSPKIIEERLEKVGIRPLGNVIDVTNYMMIDKGQPMHVFDYDKILGHKMIVRESIEGEIITTLDDVERKLPAGVIVIEDGEGRLIDLCGIMGAKNSEVDENTKKILLFVQVYNPIRIRKASMSLGHRTDAALRFEKGIDYEGVIPALWESVNMISELSGAKVSSQLIDIVNYDREEKEIELSVEKINKIAGIEIKDEEIAAILSDLGFEKVIDGKVKVPSWRYEDVGIAEDLAEEVIRVYGYYKLPAKLPSGEIPVKESDEIFYWEKVVKYFLKFQGFFECYNYSATLEKNVSEKALKLANPLNEDMTHMKTSLLPQLLEIIEKNQGYSNKIKIFEIGSVYLQDGIESGDKIPQQPLKLGLVTKGVDYLELKGIIEGMFEALGLDFVNNIEIKEFGNETLGVELDFEELVNNATKTKSYTPLTGFNSIREDLTFEIPEGVLYSQIEKVILETDERISELTFKDIYQNYLTFSIEYLDKEKQISSDDTQEIRKKIFDNLQKLGVKLKE